MGKESYKWTYCSLGNAVRVNVTSGEDIAHLGELDQKMWTVLSCPTKGLEFDHRTLELLDTDKDGKIRVPEVVAAAQWLTSVIRDRDSILAGADTLALSNIDDSNAEGARLLSSARQILANLKLDKQEISVNEALDSTAIFAGSAFNGDGVITALSTDDESLKSLIATIADKMGATADRSGEKGVTAEAVEAFYTQAGQYCSWSDASAADGVLPFGSDTASARAAVEAVREKIEDYFIRCRLIAFDEAVSAVVDVSVDRIGAAGAGTLSAATAELAASPIARPGKSAILPYDAINPAWQAAFAALRAQVLDKMYPDAKEITEEQWQAAVASFAAYDAWVASKPAVSVEALGADALKSILKEDRKAELLALVEKDKALAADAASIDEVGKLLLYYRDFARLLRNYVLFSDFYSRDGKTPAVFEAGQLYIDRRCCKLCIRVEDMGKHADMAAQSGMFLIYCSCTSKTKAATMNIVAVMTDGDITSLRPGKNGIFYDLQGNDWDAVITKVVDNPVSIRQAFWSPYRKLANFITDKINKNAAQKETDATSKLLAAADKPAPATAGQPFDIAKFAGITAALGMAIGAIGVAVSSIFKGIFALAWWQLLLVIVVILLLISGPSCFIAWTKLRKRNLGPLLNANGWAINSVLLVNILFGSTLTSVAKYPKLHLSDPYAKRTPTWRKWLYGILIVALLGGIAALFISSRRCKTEDNSGTPASEISTEPGTGIEGEAAEMPQQGTEQ